jgi:hypothetical protein
MPRALRTIRLARFAESQLHVDKNMNGVHKSPGDGSSPNLQPWSTELCMRRLDQVRGVVHRLMRLMYIRFRVGAWAWAWAQVRASEDNDAIYDSVHRIQPPAAAENGVG